MKASRVMELIQELRDAELCVGRYVEDQARRGRADTHFDGELWRMRHEAIMLAHQIAAACDPATRELSDGLPGAAVVSGIAEAVGSPLVALGLDEIAFSAAHEKAGLPTFDLTAGLMAELLLTDCGRIHELDVPWPFPAFRVTLPYPDCGVPFARPNGEIDRVQSFTVLFWNAGNSQGEAQDALLGTSHRMIARSRSPEQMSLAISQHLARLGPQERFLHPEKTLVIRAFGRDGTSVFQHQPWGSATIGERIEQTFRAESIHGGAFSSDHALDDIDRHAVAALQRLVVNLCLYLSSTNPQTKRAEWVPTDRTMGKRGRTWRIGGSVKVSKEVREAASQIARGAHRESPLVRHIVRGHFKQQPVGHGRAERKRIYVAPYWRGPLEGPSAPRKYRVE